MGAAFAKMSDTGLPALIVLLCLMIVLPVVAFMGAIPKFTGTTELAAASADELSARKNVLAHAIIVAGLSLVFWIWALFNTVSDDFDFGLISFLFAGVIAVTGGFSVARAGNSPRAIQIYKWLSVISGGLVCLNYGIAAFCVDPAWQIFYCLVGCVLWIFLAFWGGRSVWLLERSLNPEEQPLTQDSENPESIPEPAKESAF